MQSIQEDMNELRGQLRTGAIQKAYRALLDYMMGLRTRFKKITDFETRFLVKYNTTKLRS